MSNVTLYAVVQRPCSRLLSALHKPGLNTSLHWPVVRPQMKITQGFGVKEPSAAEALVVRGGSDVWVCGAGGK